MNKLFIVIGIILLLFLSFFFGWLSFLNAPVNQILYGPVDLSCTVDDDCALTKYTCAVPCACQRAANKDYQHNCFFGYSSPNALCKPCPGPFDFELRCINNECRQEFRVITSID